MERSVEEISRLATECTCGINHKEILIEQITIKENALVDSVEYLRNKGFKRVMIVCDENTFLAAGKQLNHLLSQQNLHSTICFITPDKNNDVVADEASIVQVFLETPKEVDVFLAVGSGTIHDIVRFVSYKMGKSFISIATAPSVDGFNSIGAPLIIRGMKQTFQLHSPIAVFGDLTVLKNAPPPMIAAGFADMIAKYTALADWKFGHLTAGEPYCPLAAEITEKALTSCVESIDKIAIGDEDGMFILFEALVQSGIAMLLIGHSYPASGGEHHISHYWEMEFLKQGTPQILHGTKVGVTSQLIAKLYKNKVLEVVTSGNYVELNPHLEELSEVINNIPDPKYMQGLLRKLGGDTCPRDLGISDPLIKESLANAHTLRNRFTMLRFLNERVL
ncbi:sn-glycerol-1-phosphate dehydrogenase [Litchfieldia alkalitelluris]|uniref:sn-glycerol-1-phosphate dehydrogenase n=1 Tax=Litchfieldia alkalitelluris TaxID=304268 RepID=UPI0009973A6A|nr:sn-glycerol-1-phosphate dehydrogenase [Litchfieldia alkalitelluris]